MLSKTLLQSSSSTGTRRSLNCASAARFTAPFNRRRLRRQQPRICPIVNCLPLIRPPLVCGRVTQVSTGHGHRHVAAGLFVQIPYKINLLHPLPHPHCPWSCIRTRHLDDPHPTTDTTPLYTHTHTHLSPLEVALPTLQSNQRRLGSSSPSRPPQFLPKPARERRLRRSYPRQPRTHNPTRGSPPQLAIQTKARPRPLSPQPRPPWIQTTI